MIITGTPADTVSPAWIGVRAVEDTDGIRPGAHLVCLLVRLSAATIAPGGLYGGWGAMYHDRGDRVVEGWDVRLISGTLLGTVLHTADGAYVAEWHHLDHADEFGGRRAATLQDALHAIACDGAHDVKDAAHARPNCALCPTYLPR